MVISPSRLLGSLAAAVAFCLGWAWADDPTATPPPEATAQAAPTPIADPALEAYRVHADRQARNYDRAQDISPRQLLILLEVAERTGISLGQALATGEHESARTWNDFVRPTLPSGNLGVASGVWQFQPATFHRIVQAYGKRILNDSAANPGAGRSQLDLADGPFSDDRVRAIIQETVDGKRDAKDEALKLLRHNFAVLAFAKHYLSIDSGAKTPEEDYLFHFLGEGQGRKILDLAQGEARHTLCVKPAEVPGPPVEETEVPALAGAAPPVIEPIPASLPAPSLAPPTAVQIRVRPSAGRPAWDARGLPPRPAPAAALGRRSIAKVDPTPIDQRFTPFEQLLPAAPAVFAAPIMTEPPPPSSAWGLPADSPTVTGNLRMFYRDGPGRTQPYTWGEFMEHLGRRVKAETQPSMVRAKYGVGFSLVGGDMPGHTFDPEQARDAAKYRYHDGLTVEVLEVMVTGTLNADETREYKERLAALVAAGEDRPLDLLPPESLTALHHLGLLAPGVQDPSTANPEVHKALNAFRSRVGKAPPDDPERAHWLMPAERVALDIYALRIARFAAVQSAQLASAAHAPDLSKYKKMPSGLLRSAAPTIAQVQTALATKGLLKQPTQKSVWRDKKRKKHVAYKPIPFAGKVDKATLAALDTYQLRQGLRRTGGVLDAVTLGFLGLSPLGRDIFLPLSGPQCPVEDGTVALQSRLPPTDEPMDPNLARLFRHHPQRGLFGSLRLPDEPQAQTAPTEGPTPPAAEPDGKTG